MLNPFDPEFLSLELEYRAFELERFASLLPVVFDLELAYHQ